ncbi:antibiotic biosynthesis monooxygenase family protein [Neobacillus sp. D3-1R]|uniref:antibiotic biosynthesis monooxygenase family protein n=1 Tax=Neobacillus sp. D3-1R TaxID=3445778 RepID=UPI003F9ED60B
MKIYITAGTYYFLNKKKQTFPKESMLLIENAEQAVLLHETNGESVFNEPRSFGVLVSKGAFINEGFVVMHYFTVTEEGKTLFEYRIKETLNVIGTQDGLLAIRGLHSLDSRTYLILTIWDQEENYKEWKCSNSYEQYHDLLLKDSGLDSVPNIFTKPSYISTYHTSEDS